MSHQEGRLESREPFDRLLHRKVVQLVCEYDSPDRVEVSRGHVIDEQRIFYVGVCGAEVVLLLVRVERVISPHNRLQVKRIGDRMNVVITQLKPDTERCVLLGLVVMSWFQT